MSKKVETEVKNGVNPFDAFQESLKPFIERLNECKRKHDNLKRGLNAYNEKLWAVQERLTLLVKKSEELLSEGQEIKFNDSVFAVKAEQKDLEQWIRQIELESLPAAKESIDQAQADLERAFWNGLDVVKGSYCGTLEEIYGRVEAIWVGYTNQTQKLLAELNIKVPSYSMDRIYNLPPLKLGQSLQNLVKNFM